MSETATVSQWTCTACPFKGPTREMIRSQDGTRLTCPKCLGELNGPIEVAVESLRDRMPESPERIWLQTTGSSEFEWTWADHEIDASDTEYVRADLHPTNAQNAVIEALIDLYSADGVWLGEFVRDDGENPYPRLWRLVQLVVNAPKPTGRQAPHIGLLRDIVSQLTGVPVEDVTAPLSEFLHTLRFPVPEPSGMVVTELDAWEGEDGG